MNLQPGDKIGGRYEIVRALTPGSHAVTYLAQDTKQQGNAQCVVKQLKPRMSSTSILQEAKKRFAREAIILERLGADEQIPQLWDYFEEEKEFYLVQEFIPGEDLSKELKKHKPFSEIQTIDLLVDVLGILAFVHQQRVIHRDIKPSNLIRRQSDRKMVLIDFGVVKELGTLSIDPESQTLYTQPVGTLAYMPPEQQEGRPTYSSDIYALGVTAIEALIGNLPPQDPKTGEILWHDRVEANGKLVEILDKMVRPNLSDRYKSVSEVLEDLEPLTKIGKTLAGRYKIKDYLGGGIFGHTYLAEDRLRRYQSGCIIKQLQPNSKDQMVLQQAEKLFETEVNILKKLGSHSQIPELLDHFEIEAEFYLVQEFIEGEEFSHEIANGKRLSQDRVVNFLLDVLQILEFIHDRQVIHCDIKPSNLIRRKSDRKIVLIDFGAVKKVVNLTMNVSRRRNSSQPTIGTEGYMPSEQIAGTTTVASDFYALGVTAIQALTGMSPDRFTKHPHTGEIVWQQGIQIHPKLAQILDKMVRYDFRQRYRQASEAIKELEKIPRSDKKNTKNWKFFNGRRGWVMLAIVAIVAFRIVIKVYENQKIDRLFEKANELRSDGNSQEVQEAIDIYDEILEIDKEIYQVWTNKGDAYGKLGKYPEMFFACKRATEAAEKKDEAHKADKAWNCQGEAKHALATKAKKSKDLSQAKKYYQEAVDSFHQAIKINPEYPFGWRNQGESLLEIEEYTQAIQCFDSAIEKAHVFMSSLNDKERDRGKTAYIQAQSLKGRALLEQERYDDAIEAYNKSLEMDSKYFPAKLGLGDAFKRNENHDEALRIFDEIIDDPDFQETEKNQARSYKEATLKEQQS